MTLEMNDVFRSWTRVVDGKLVIYVWTKKNEELVLTLTPELGCDIAVEQIGDLIRRREMP